MINLMIKRIISFYESIGSGYEVVKRSIEPRRRVVTW